MTDFRLCDHGSVVILTPVTDDAKEYASDMLPEDTQRWAGGYVIEPRYADDVIGLLLRDGFEVKS